MFADTNEKSTIWSSKFCHNSLSDAFIDGSLAMAKKVFAINLLVTYVDK